MATSKTGLDLSTTGEVVRSSFKIDGKEYLLRAFGELSISDQQRVAYAGKFIQDYLISEPDASKDAKAEALLDTCLQVLVLDFPVEVQKKLTDGQKVSILHEFNDTNNLEAPEQGGGL